MPRRSKSASSVEEMLSALDANQRAIVEALRALVKKTDPQATEALKWGMPVFEDNGMLCYIAPMSNTVNFGFYQDASEFDDPNGLLEGTGKKMRHVKLRSAGDIQKALFTKWLRRAVELNRSGQNLMRNRGAKTSTRATATKSTSAATKSTSAATKSTSAATKSTSAATKSTRASATKKSNVASASRAARTQKLQSAAKNSGAR